MNVNEMLQELGMLIVDNEQALELLAQIQGAIPTETTSTETEQELSPEGLPYKDAYELMCAKCTDIKQKYVSRFLNPPTEMQTGLEEEETTEDEEQGGIDSLFTEESEEKE